MKIVELYEAISEVVGMMIDVVRFVEAVSWPIDVLHPLLYVGQLSLRDASQVWSGMMVVFNESSGLVCHERRTNLILPVQLSSIFGEHLFELQHRVLSLSFHAPILGFSLGAHCRSQQSQRYS